MMNGYNGLTIRFTFRGSDGSEYLDYTSYAKIVSLSTDEFKNIINKIEKDITAYYHRDRLDDLNQSVIDRIKEEAKFNQEYNSVDESKSYNNLLDNNLDDDLNNDL